MQSSRWSRWSRYSPTSSSERSFRLGRAPGPITASSCPSGCSSSSRSPRTRRGRCSHFPAATASFPSPRSFSRSRFRTVGRGLTWSSECKPRGSEKTPGLNDQQHKSPPARTSRAGGDESPVESASKERSWTPKKPGLQVATKARPLFPKDSGHTTSRTNCRSPIQIADSKQERRSVTSPGEIVDRDVCRQQHWGHKCKRLVHDDLRDSKPKK